jgi:colicin import membrane protein
LAEGNHEAGDYSGVLLKSAHLITLRHGCSVMPRGNSSPARSLKAACLLLGGLLAGVASSADQAPATGQEADWEQRLARAAELQRSAAAGKAAAEKLLEEKSTACYRKFLVNRCLDEAQGEYLEANKDARRQNNEGKAIERQVKKEQFSAREAGWAAEMPTREAELRAREAETAAARAEAEAAAAATRASKARKAEEGAQRKAEDAERLRRKQADHEARVAAQVEKADAKAAATTPAKP